MNKKVRNIIMAIVDVVIVGYINFYNLSNDKEPLFVVKENNYTTNSGDEVYVYDNIIYKIVKHEEPGKKLTYSLRLWFMDDIKK